MRVVFGELLMPNFLPLGNGATSESFGHARENSKDFDLDTDSYIAGTLRREHRDDGSGVELRSSLFTSNALSSDDS